MNEVVYEGKKTREKNYKYKIEFVVESLIEFDDEQGELWEDAIGGARDIDEYIADFKITKIG